VVERFGHVLVSKIDTRSSCFVLDLKVEVLRYPGSDVLVNGGASPEVVLHAPYAIGNGNSEPVPISLYQVSL
jgi:hypothetical protein